MTTSIYQAALRNETYDLSTCNAYATSICCTAYLVKCHVKRCDREVCHIHRHLCNAVLLDEPADSLTCLECTRLHDGVTVLILHDLTGDGVTLTHGATLLAHVEGDGVSTTCRCAIEVVVYSNEEVACTYGCSTCLCNTLIVGASTEVGLALLVHHLLGQCLVLTCTTYCEVAALGSECCCLVAICRNVNLLRDALCKSTCELCTLLQSDARYGDQGAYVASTHTGVCTLVLTHVDKFSSALDSSNSCVAHCLGLTYEGNNGAVCSLTWINIQKLHALSGVDNICNLLDDLSVATLREVRYALNNSFLHSFRFYFSC